MKQLLIILIAILGLLLSGCTNIKIDSIRNDESIGLLSPTPEMSNEIFITSDGLNPKAIEVELGETVKFINLDSQPHIIASDPHPEHDELPGLYSDPIYQSETYEFKFSRTGQFGFHIEENPSFSGKVVVK